MDSQPTYQQDQQELNQLQQQLSESLQASGFLASASGQFLQSLYAKHITILTRKVTSDEFLKDHTGYVNAVCQLQAYKKILKELQVAGAPARIAKIREKLDGKENA